MKLILRSPVVIRQKSWSWNGASGTAGWNSVEYRSEVFNRGLIGSKSFSREYWNSLICGHGYLSPDVVERIKRESKDVQDHTSNGKESRQG